MTDSRAAVSDLSRHTLLEDIYATLTGCSFAVFGLVWLQAAGLVTGGVAGLALLLSYLLDAPLGLLFALANIPFFLAARRSMGTTFALKAVLATILIGFLTTAAPLAFRIEDVSSPFAALFGGTLIGVGILQLARHQVGIGGIGALALALQKSRGWNAGRTMLIADALVLSLALLLPNLTAERFALSMASALATAAVLMVFHKPARYIGH